MGEPKETLSSIVAPHLHAADSVARRYWGRVAAFLPVFLASLFWGKAELLRLFLLSAVSAVAFEFLAAKFFRKGEKLYHGEAILVAGWIALLMPRGCPYEWVLAANFLAIVIAKECLGGMGQYLLQPAFFARVFLQEGFPSFIRDPLLLEGGMWTGAALGLGILILIWQRQGYWEVPVLYGTVYFLTMILLGRWGEEPLRVFNGVLLISFFLLTDPVPTPLTRGGTGVFAAGAAFLTASMNHHGSFIPAAGVSIIFMNLLTPWIDFGGRVISRKTAVPLPKEQRP